MDFFLIIFECQNYINKIVSCIRTHIQLSPHALFQN